MIRIPLVAVCAVREAWNTHTRAAADARRALACVAKASTERSDCGPGEYAVSASAPTNSIAAAPELCHASRHRRPPHATSLPFPSVLRSSAPGPGYANPNPATYVFFSSAPKPLRPAPDFLLPRVCGSPVPPAAGPPACCSARPAAPAAVPSPWARTLPGTCGMTRGAA
jgi:hypothetical protein